MHRLITCLGLLDSYARRCFAVLLVLTVVGAALETVSVSLIFPYVALIARPEQIRQHPQVAAAFDTLGFADERTFMLALGAVLVALFVIKSAFGVFFLRFQIDTMLANARRLCRRMLARYLQQPFIFHLEHHSAELITRTRELPHNVFGGFLLGYVTLLSELVVVLCLTGLVLLVEPLATLVAGVGGVLLIGVYQRLAGGKVHDLGQRRHEFNGRVLQNLQQALGGIKETKVLGREHGFLEAFSQAEGHFVETQGRYQFLAQLPRLVNETVMVGGMLLAVMAIVAQGGTDTATMLSHFAVMAAAAFRLMPSVNRISQALVQIRGNAHAIDMLRNETAGDAAALWRANFTDTPRVAMPFTRRLAFEGVGYTYPKAERPALDGVSLSIEAGEIIGFVGPSGAGKTTLVDVLLGLLEPQSGRLAVDGADIAADRRAWQANLGYVPQSIFLTNDSVRANVAFGVAHEQVDDTQVWSALKAAHLDETVRAMPQGLDTVLGENGTRLSGGQRQRIGIARALYHDPAVLVFDEATSALDNDTEHEVTRAIEALGSHKTVIIIAHRLSTVRNCNRVFLLRQGRLVASGSLEQLAQADAAFKRMLERDHLRAQPHLSTESEGIS